MLEERWYKGQETWLKLSSTASPETRRRVRATVTPYDPDNPGSFEPTMSRGEANATIVEWNIDSMG